MSDIVEVHVSAFVPKNNPVTLIDAAELKRLRAENEGLRDLCAEYASKIGFEFGYDVNWQDDLTYNMRVESFNRAIDERKEV